MQSTDSNPTMEIVSPSPLAAVVAMFCMVTIVINLSVCYYIYCKRSLRSSCTALIVANLAAVDVLVSIKDLPILISVSTSGRWYFEEQWCRLYGLTNVIYIIVAVSTLVTITSERYFRCVEPIGSPRSASPQGRSMPLGYIIAHTTLSYSLSLLWSKYVFISRKAFCQIDWPPSGIPYTVATSLFFLVPVSMLIYNFFGREKDEEIARKLRAATGKISELEQGEKSFFENEKSHGHLQTAIAVFLITWSPYVVESFFTYSSEVPNVVGVVCACIPIATTTLIPLWYVKWRRDCDMPKPFAMPAQNC